MSEIIECPHCGSRVVPMSQGNCPSCLKNVNDVEEIKKSQKMDEIYFIIGNAYKLGIVNNDIIKSCLDAGFNEDLIQETMSEYRKKEEARLFNAVFIGFWFGILILLAGAIITFVTLYYIDLTGIGFFAYGAMAIGLASILSSWYLRFKMKKSLGS